MSENLSEKLKYQPKTLAFGTSGRRGEVIHLTQLEIYINALAEVRYLQSLPLDGGGIATGDDFYFAYDLRPSSIAFAPEYGGRGEIAQAIAEAIRNAGMRPVNLGCLPTPALTFYALQQGKGSIMVTGSHIPFDRNGYKLNTSKGELLKHHEAPINAAVQEQRERIYSESYSESKFNADGMLKSGHIALPTVHEGARQAYLRRYLDFFAGKSLAGMRLLVYQHSAVARDMLLEVVEALGADAVADGRSTEFVPIDTENIDAAQLAAIQKLADAHPGIDAVISTDGDSDRPLILGVENGKVQFFGGDLVGMVVADYLNADAVVVPISCNDSIDRGSLAKRLYKKTRIGSPFVIAAMEQARQDGKKTICGWEANGGFLLGSDLPGLPALATRDAFLPILCTLFSAKERGVSLTRLFDSVAVRFSKAGLLKNFPREVSMRILQRFTPADVAHSEFVLADQAPQADVHQIASNLCRLFSGFGAVSKLNYVDGVRITFQSGEVAHLRPSGNADELRIYAVADSRERAGEIVSAALAEPEGILRRMEKECSGHQGA